MTQHTLFDLPTVGPPSDVDLVPGARRKREGTTYLRTLPYFDARESVRLTDTINVSRISSSEAQRLAKFVRSNHVFSRIGNHRTYLERAESLAGETVLHMRAHEVVSADDMRERADLAVRCLLLARTLAGERGGQVRSLTGAGHGGFDLHISPYEYGVQLRSNSEGRPRTSGLRLGGVDSRRISRLGIGEFYEFLVEGSKLAASASRGLDWLWQSRFERDVRAAAVKTSTALESILVFGRERPTQMIRERRACEGGGVRRSPSATDRDPARASSSQSPCKERMTK